MEKSLQEACEEFRNSIIELWESIREVSDRASEARTEIEYEKAYRSTWHVPVKIEPTKLPPIVMPRIKLPRSNL